MRKFIIVFIISTFLISYAIIPENLEAKSKKQSKKIEKIKSKKKYTKRYRKSQTPSQSLIILEKYFPEYKSIIASLNKNIIQTISQKNQVSNSIFNDNNTKAKLLININDWLGTPYKRGGHSKAGVDCSNFTSCMIEELFGSKFPRSPGAQVKYFKPIYKIEDLQFGDFVFFSGTRASSKRIGHVGIYIGNGCFAHSSSASNRWGVVYTHISESNYLKRFRFGGRFDISSWVKL